MHKAFFLDRDGTLNKDTDNVHLPEEWVWCEGAVEALKQIQENGFKMIVVTNQSGISKGLFEEADTRRLHQWVDGKLREYNISIDGWYYSPYHPDFDNGTYNPEDRKPGIGMFKKAADEYQIDFNQSYMAGDKITDLIPAIELGIVSFFIRSRFEPFQDKDWLKEHQVACFDSLLEVTEELW